MSMDMNIEKHLAPMKENGFLCMHILTKNYANRSGQVYLVWLNESMNERESIHHRRKKTKRKKKSREKICRIICWCDRFSMRNYVNKNQHMVNINFYFSQFHKNACRSWPSHWFFITCLDLFRLMQYAHHKTNAARWFAAIKAFETKLSKIDLRACVRAWVS